MDLITGQCGASQQGCGEHRCSLETGQQSERLGLQYTKNARHHTGIGRSPYKAMFGKEAALGVEHLNLESSLAKHVANEEDLTTMFPR